MSIRKIEKMPSPKLYKDDYMMDSIIHENSGMKVSDNSILSANVVDMIEGEPQIDFKNKRQVIKIKGFLYRQTVDENQNVILTKTS